jgi:hypothetical protein
VSDQPLEDLFARLERERQNADRAYNDALTALDRAIQPPPVLPDAPKSLDRSGAGGGGAAAANEVVGAASAALGGVRAILWRILGSPPCSTPRAVSSTPWPDSSRSSSSTFRRSPSTSTRKTEASAGVNCAIASRSSNSA